MKISIFTLAAAAGLLVASTNTFAKKSRVNNNSTDPTVFKSLIEFFEDTQPAADGCDTIYLEGSNSEYTPTTITRKVCIIGPGFNLMDNPNTSVSTLEAKLRFADISFNEGSEGSELIGVNMISQSVQVSADNITIRNCIFNNGGVGLWGSTNTVIVQNYFASSQSADAIFIFGNESGNITFNNNIVSRYRFVVEAPSSFQECNNNVFVLPSGGADASLSISTLSFKNNIIKPASATNIPSISVNGGTADPDKVSHNIFPTGGSLSTSHNNLPVAHTGWGAVFVQTNPTKEIHFATLQPAYLTGNLGSDGTQRGILGGQFPYKLSGIAVIPNVYGLETNGQVSSQNGLQLKIKTKVNPR